MIWIILGFAISFPRHSELPLGFKPVWINCPKKAQHQVDILKFVSNIPQMKQRQFKSVIVIHNGHNQEAEDWCLNRDWQYDKHRRKIYGTEYQVCIMIDKLSAEVITRATNLLVLVTSRNKEQVTM